LILEDDKGDLWILNDEYKEGLEALPEFVDFYWNYHNGFNKLTPEFLASWRTFCASKDYDSHVLPYSDIISSLYDTRSKNFQNGSYYSGKMLASTKPVSAKKGIVSRRVEVGGTKESFSYTVKETLVNGLVTRRDTVSAEHTRYEFVETPDVVEFKTALESGSVRFDKLADGSILLVGDKSIEEQKLAEWRRKIRKGEIILKAEGK
jgi:hypothetical protein